MDGNGRRYGREQVTRSQLPGTSGEDMCHELFQKCQELMEELGCSVFVITSEDGVSSKYMGSEDFVREFQTTGLKVKPQDSLKEIIATEKYDVMQCTDDEILKPKDGDVTFKKPLWSFGETQRTGVEIKTEYMNAFEETTDVTMETVSNDERRKGVRDDKERNPVAMTAREERNRNHNDTAIVTNDEGSYVARETAAYTSGDITERFRASLLNADAESDGKTCFTGLMKTQDEQDIDSAVGTDCDVSDRSHYSESGKIGKKLSEGQYEEEEEEEEDDEEEDDDEGEEEEEADDDEEEDDGEEEEEEDDEEGEEEEERKLTDEERFNVHDSKRRKTCEQQVEDKSESQEEETASTMTSRSKVNRSERLKVLRLGSKFTSEALRVLKSGLEVNEETTKVLKSGSKVKKEMSKVLKLKSKVKKETSKIRKSSSKVPKDKSKMVRRSTFVKGVRLMSGDDVEKFKEKVRTAMREDDAEKLFSCERCGLSFKDQHLSELHKLHDTCKEKKCRYCGIHLIYNSLREHKVNNHIAKLKLWKCKLCSKEFLKRDTLVTKHALTHGCVDRVTCEICNKTFLRKDSLKQHMKTVHIDKKVQCGICNHKFSEKYLPMHMTVHSDDKLACEICGTRVSNRITLRTHMESHMKWRYNCTDCGKQFTKKHDLQIHANRHSANPELYPCTECGRVFLLKQGLRKHYNNVHNRQLFLCDICGKRLCNKHSLKMHQSSHNPVKSCWCELCKKGFTSKEYLKQHMKTHSSEKPFQCEVCGYRCKLKGNMNKHMRVHQRSEVTAIKTNVRCEATNV
ncbi:uncharacterized protein LOC144450351 [Glandiceps talaboti]